MWIKLKNGDETYARSIQFEDILKEKIEAKYGDLDDEMGCYINHN